MKNATVYEKKIKKLLSGAVKARNDFYGSLDQVEVMLVAILEANAPRKAALGAYQTLKNEYVDLNELRVSQPKEIVDSIGRDFPQGREKAEVLVKALNSVFDRTCQMTMAYMEKMPKRDLRKHLLGLGLGSYASAVLMLYLFDSHAIPVDQDLVDSLAMEEYIHPGSDIDDVQGFLERVIPQKDAISAHDFLRLHVEKMSKSLAKKRKEDADAAAKIAAEAAAAAKKIADAKAAAEAEKAAKAAAKAEAAKAREDAEKAKETARISAHAKAHKKSRK